MTDIVIKLAKYFYHVKDVFWIKIYASRSVNPLKIEHAANAMPGDSGLHLRSQSNPIIPF